MWKSGENLYQAVSEKTFKDHAILYMYIAQEQGQETLGEKFWL